MVAQGETGPRAFQPSMEAEAALSASAGVTGDRRQFGRVGRPVDLRLDPPTIHGVGGAVADLVRG